MTKRPDSLLDEVVKTASAVFQGTIPWYRRLPEKHLAEVLELKKAYKAGKLSFPLRTLARAISKSLRERGIATIGEQGVQAWLTKDD